MSPLPTATGYSGSTRRRLPSASRQSGCGRCRPETRGKIQSRGACPTAVSTQRSSVAIVGSVYPRRQASLFLTPQWLCGLMRPALEAGRGSQRSTGTGAHGSSSSVQFETLLEYRVGQDMGPKPIDLIRQPRECGGANTGVLGKVHWHYLCHECPVPCNTPMAARSNSDPPASVPQGLYSRLKRSNVVSAGPSLRLTRSKRGIYEASELYPIDPVLGLSLPPARPFHTCAGEFDPSLLDRQNSTSLPSRS